MGKKIAALLLATVLTASVTGCTNPVEPDPSGISKAEYDQIQIGMDQYDVADVIGGGGVLAEETEEKLEDYHFVYTRVYDYKGETTGSAKLTFKADIYYGKSETKLVAKEQSDLG